MIEELPKENKDKKKEFNRAFHSYLRNQNKLYVNSFNMIDRKAAIMIRINATIISAIIIFFQQIREMPYGRAMGLTLVLFCFFSLLFAINASRPHIYSLALNYREKVKKKYPSLSSNLFTVGMNDNKTLEEYEQAYDELFERQDLQVGNQVRAMFSFEHRIKQSFKYIEISYACIMIGFVLVIGLFFYINIDAMLSAQ
ncbi:hypothetical protein [Nonlabens ponticola]|uniref:Pycsar effector protein domain-containing protein n=1 Tax=Nonlabens ponticola TaxID=2496866 RepID=A0A3S9MYG8_9FLAO|nr:hypothetical protein [Nonlabens ponticola]AZQ44295.1 hypothetical protein EJ995_08625 [Nonlabens ponticola]